MVTMIKELNLLNIIVRAYTSTKSIVSVLCARLVETALPTAKLLG